MKMKITLMISLFALALMAACNTPADNRPTANTAAGNANTANTATAPKAAAPTKEALVAIEKKAWKDWAERNTAGLEGYMASKFVNVGNNGASDRAAAMKSWTSHKCEMGEVAFSDDAVTELGDGVALLTFKATGEIKCDGKPGPDPVNVSVLYVKEGDGWKAMYYQEVPTADAKGEYAPPTTPFDKANELASFPAAAEDIAANEKNLWETWKNRDEKGFRDGITNDIVGNGRTGRVSGADSYVKYSFDPNCKIESYSTGPMKAMEVSKDVTMIIYRSSQKGACGTERLPENVLSVSIYRRENGKPKAAYYMENPVRN